MKKNHSFAKYTLVFFLGAIMGSCITYFVGRYGEKALSFVSQNVSDNSETEYDAEQDFVDGEYQGIDVSNHQGEISWENVALNKNIQFVYIKATEGATYKDKRYDENVRGAKANGLLIGSYHYLRNTSLIRKQFVNFKNVAKKESQDLIPMVDVEEEVEKDSILLFCNLLKEYYGRRPIVYGTNRSYNQYCAPDFNDYYLMIGRYGNKPPVITGKGHYNIWQYSEKGRIEGVPKLVDLDRFHPDFNLSNLKL